MHIFQRTIESKIKAQLFKNRAVLIFGPRQVGKTTLSKKLLRDESGDESGYFNCELADVRQAFVPGKPDLVKKLVGDKKIVVFDEAQTIEDIGRVLKTFIDTYPEIQIIATGSSSFDLANKINEPLTGRAFEFTLLPLSLDELRGKYPHLGRGELNELMRLGAYPAVVAESDSVTKESILRNLATNYLYKDVYVFESIKHPRGFEELVRLLALQVGSLISVNELSQTLGMSRATVEKYIRLLEQSYVVRVVRSFSRNPRTEIKKAVKIFFLDTGIRNAVLGKLQGMDTRDDRGALFENFFIAERMKKSAGGDPWTRIMFWRDRHGEEIDVVEESGEVIRAFECKWKTNGNVRIPPQFLKSYPTATFEAVTPETLLW